MNPNHQKLIDDLESKVTAASAMIAQAQYDDLSNYSQEIIYSHMSGLRASIQRVSGSNSSYDTEAGNAQNDGKSFVGEKLRRVHGIASAALSDAKSGMLEHLTELVHAETFADFVDMAEHLLDGAYKDAAAVIAGSALEMHLRNLARKTGVPVETSDGKPLKSDRINADLVKANVYSKLDQKNVTAWLDLRNKAAHGHYSEYSSEQVQLLVSSVRDFATRNPA